MTGRKHACDPHTFRVSHSMDLERCDDVAWAATYPSLVVVQRMKCFIYLADVLTKGIEARRTSLRCKRVPRFSSRRRGIHIDEFRKIGAIPSKSTTQTQHPQDMVLVVVCGVDGHMECVQRVIGGAHFHGYSTDGILCSVLGLLRCQRHISSSQIIIEPSTPFAPNWGA